MSREFTYQLIEGHDKMYLVTTTIDDEEKRYKCVVANDSSELAELLELSITTEAMLANTP